MQQEVEWKENMLYTISRSRLEILTFVGLGDGAFVGFAMPPVSTMSVGFIVGTFVPEEREANK